MPYAISRRARRDIDGLAADLERAKGMAVAEAMLDGLQTTFDMLGEH